MYIFLAFLCQSSSQWARRCHSSRWIIRCGSRFDFGGIFRPQNQSLAKVISNCSCKLRWTNWIFACSLGRTREGRRFPGLMVMGKHLLIAGGETTDAIDRTVILDSMETLVGKRWVPLRQKLPERRSRFSLLRIPRNYVWFFKMKYNVEFASKVYLVHLFDLASTHWAESMTMKPCEVCQSLGTL